MSGALPLVALLGFMWGSGLACVKLALNCLDPVQMAFVRLVLAWVVLRLILRWQASGEAAARAPRPPLGPLLRLVVFGNLIPYVLIAWGSEDLPSAAAAITNATTPLFTGLLAVLLAREARPSVVRLVGLAVGFAGVAIMFGAGFSGGSLSARFMLLGAAASYGVAFVAATAPGLAASSLARISAAQLGTAAVAIAPFAAVATARHGAGWNVEGTLAVAWLGVVTTGLATVVQLRCVRLAGPTTASLATYLVPVVGVVLGVLLLGERLRGTVFTGALVTGIGIVLAERARSERAPQVAEAA